MHTGRFYPPEPDEISELGIAAAWREALKATPRTGHDFVIGIAKEGELIARGALNAYAQVARFTTQMDRLGYGVSSGARYKLKHSCDLVFCYVLPPWRPDQENKS